MVKKRYYQEKYQTPNQNEYFPPALLTNFMFLLVEVF